MLVNNDARIYKNIQKHFSGHGHDYQLCAR